MQNKISLTYKNQHLLGVTLALLGGVFWGFSGASSQFLFEQKSLSPEWLVSIRLLAAGIMLFVLVWFYKGIRIFDVFKDKNSFIMLLVYAIFGLFLCQYTYFVAIDLSNAAIATVLQYTAPAFIMLLVSFKERKVPKFIEITALFSAMSGVFLLATHGDFSLNLPLNALLIGLLSAICVVIYSISPIKLNKSYGTATILSLGLIIGGIFSAIFTKFWQLGGVSDIPGILAVISVVFFGTILAFGFYMLGLNLIGPTKASLIASIEPVSAAVFANLWLKVEFVFMDFVGFFLILFCTALLSYNKN